MTENSLRDSVRGRFWGYVGGQLARYGRLEHATSGPGAGDKHTRRASEYMVRWAYYENKKLYHLLHDLGLVSCKMETEYNPVPTIVGFYVSNALAGELELEYTPLETEEGQEAAEPAGLDGDESPDAAASTGDNVIAAIEQVWEWSNFEALKRSLTETAAVISDVYIKVAERVKADFDEPFAEITGVYMQQIPSEAVRYCETDERGFVTAIRIDTPRFESIFGGGDREHTLVELWRKDWGEDTLRPDTANGARFGGGGVRFYETEGRAYLEDKDLPDPVRVETFEELQYDFIPVVAASAPTYWWQETDKIDRYNWLAYNADRLNRPLLVVLGNATDSDGRPMPAPAVSQAQLQATYHEAGDGAVGVLRMPGRSTAEWANAPIDFSSHLHRMERLQEHIEGSLPEYRMATIGASQIATETLKILLSMAGQRVLEVRAVLERALVRAQMMALTIGQVAGLEMFAREHIGVYENGTLDHQFAERDVFTLSEELMATVLKNLVAAGMPIKLAMKAAGYTEVFIEAFDAAAAEQSARDQASLARALVQARMRLDSGAADNGLARPEIAPASGDRT